MKIISKYLIIIYFFIFQLTAYSETKNSCSTLKAAFAGKFYIGTAMNSEQINCTDTASINVIKDQFSAIVPENVMKCEVLQPIEGKFNFTLADKFVEFGERNNKFITGHTLVWGSQNPQWLFVDENGSNVSKEVMIKRMYNYITKVVSHYKGRVKGWDVVNEALNEDGTLVQNLWYKIIGPEYIQLAFDFAHKADPTAELYYNDYNLYKPSKRAGAIRLIKKLKANGCRIDAVGEQGHYGLTSDIFNDLEQSIVEFSKLAVKVMITELDVTILPFPTKEITADVEKTYKNNPKFNPYPKNVVPQKVKKEFTDYYLKLFKIFIKHENVISRVTLWGVNDGQSWRNYWPINSRVDFPLLFDRNNKAKPVVEAIIKEAEAHDSNEKILEIGK